MPCALAGLLSATGAEHEGGYSDSVVRLALFAALVVGPIALAVCISVVSHGRRAPAIVMSIVSVLLGVLLALDFAAIGT